MEPNRYTLCPGFGFRVNYFKESGSSFPSAVNPIDMCRGHIMLELTTLREFTMLQIMNSITDKPDWRTKVFSDDTANKWKQEALEMPGKDISRPMMDWVIDELRYKAKLHEDTGAVCIYTGHVIKSDIIVPESLKLELQAAVAKLEDVSEKPKDWHPGSNGKVLNLVDPSLYPLVYGRTRVLGPERTSLEDCIARCGEGKTTKIPTEDEASSVCPNLPRNKLWYYDITADTSPYSRKFQWLPCTVDISGKQSNITSYINNLHPVKYKSLYRLIERVIDAAIPLWDLALGPLQFCVWSDEWTKFLRVIYFGVDTELIEQPEPDSFRPTFEPPTPGLKESYPKLQIIVKLANIHLTPENPSYEGGSWLVTGHLNEHICATALYRYSSENIEASNLAFRQQSSTESLGDLDSYPQDFLPAVFGCEPGGPGVQVVGSVEIREGRLITFPNIFQQQVQPFSLADPTKPGHCKTLSLFLVDPYVLILSTAHVPCQQRDWWCDYMAQQVGTSLNRLPVELRDMIFKEVADGFPFGLNEAKKFRLSLMDERKTFAMQQDEVFKGLQFSL